MDREKYLELMDSFAMAALTGYLANHGSPHIYCGSDDSNRWASDMAYTEAENMMASREEMIAKLEEKNTL